MFHKIKWMWLLKQIRQANDFEIQQVMEAVRHRYAVKHPNWDVVYIAVHKEPAQRTLEVKQIVAMIKKEATDPLS